MIHIQKLRHLTALSCALLLILITGCASRPDPTRRDLSVSAQMATGAPEGLRPYYQRLYWEGETNGTLNRMRLASAAMDQQEWKEAEHALDDVIRAIEARGPADERSRKALNAFDPEEIKRFKGEAYERSMAYFLRGILYLREQNWSNARACFKSVQFQDAAKNDPAEKGTWASADWLEGWCNANLGQTEAAQECWNRAKQNRLHSLSPPRAENHIVCVALLGFGPVKITKGRQGEHLAYKKSFSTAKKVQVRNGGDSQSLSCAEDLTSQATSRGLREMDLANEDKADIQTGTDVAGDVLVVGGLGATVGGAVAHDSTAALAGLGAAAAGMITKGVASAIQTKADTRSWDLLPATIHVGSFSPPPKNKVLEIQLVDSRGFTIREESFPVKTDKEPQFILIMER
jgi:tetratricopeptide (TPR) repeat protein